MATLQVAVMAEKVIVDAESNSPSLINLLNGFKASTLGFQAGAVFVVFSSWRRDQAGEEIEVSMIPERPDGTFVEEARETQLLVGDLPTHRWLLRPRRWVIDEEGSWKVHLQTRGSSGWDTAAVLPLDVGLISAE